MGEGWVMGNQSLISGFWCSPLLPLCKVKLLDRKLKRAKEKKKEIGSQQQEKQTISPQELTGNSLHSFQWIVLVWWQHNNSHTGDKPIKRNTLKNRWKAVLRSHLSYKNMRGCLLGQSGQQHFADWKDQCVGICNKSTKCSFQWLFFRG